MLNRSVVLIVVLVWLLGGCRAHAPDNGVNMAPPVVIPNTSILPAAIALPPADAPYLAYHSGPPAYAIYFRQLGQPAEMVGVAGNRQRAEISLSLALTPQQQPGIVYVDDRTGDLIYAERTAMRWLTETVDTAGQVGYFPALAYDQRGQPHISYFDHSRNDVKYAVRQGNNWRIETIDARGQPGFHIPAGFTRLALSCPSEQTTCDPARPHVAYLGYRYKPYDGKLRYATRYERGWQIETVDVTRGAGGFPALVLDQHNRPWISYYRVSTWDYNQGELRLAHHDGQRWQIERIDTRGNAGRYNALALTPNGQPVIAYYAATPADLRLAWFRDTWHTTTLLSEGGVGGWITLAIDAQAHLTYADTGKGHTYYTTLTLPDT